MRQTAFVFAIAFAIALPGAAMAEGQELAAQRDGDALVYRAGGFSSVALGTPATVEVHVGDAWSIRATGPAGALARIMIEREGSALRIRSRERWNFGRNADDQKVRVSITMPRLEGASIGGSGRMIVDRVSGDSLRASIGGSGSLMFRSVAVSDLSLSIGGSGSISVAGSTDRLTVRSSGSGGVIAPGLRAASAKVSTAGSGRVRAMVNGPATVSMAGSGSVDLGDGARCTVSRVGSGRAICGG